MLAGRLPKGEPAIFLPLIPKSWRRFSCSVSYLKDDYSMLKHTTMSGALLLAALTAGAQQLTPAAILITPENRLSVKDKDMRNAVRDWSREQLASTQYARISAHPSAAVFPGTVGKSAARVSETVNIDHRKISDALAPVVSTLRYSQPWRNNMYSTGLYAVAGEYIEVTVPEELLNKDVCIQIGAHSDKLSEWVAGGEDWRRLPEIVRVDTLRKKTTRIASPFGGLIYVTASPRSDSWSAGVKISRAVKRRSSSPAKPRRMNGSGSWPKARRPGASWPPVK